MKAVYKSGTVTARCPGCDGEQASFVSQNQHSPDSTITVQCEQSSNGQQYTRIHYMLLRCSRCGRGALATIHDFMGVTEDLAEFFPVSVDKARLPAAVPQEILSEFREAELCAAHGAWRASSAMLRSVLEKTLKLNGYLKRNLKENIDEAAKDGVITIARMNRAHQEVRVLGNDILHDAWRVVSTEEYELSHHYSQRILEDFYDNRSDVEAILRAKHRIT